MTLLTMTILVKSDDLLMYEFESHCLERTVQKFAIEISLSMLYIIAVNTTTNIVSKVELSSM